jgi:hypothetical protein
MCDTRVAKCVKSIELRELKEYVTCLNIVLSILTDTTSKRHRVSAIANIPYTVVDPAGIEDMPRQRPVGP